MSRPKALTLAPTALDRNGLSTTETLAAARLDFLINGALAVSGSYDRDGICAAQTTSGATALLLNGALGIDFRDRKGVYVLIYAASADNSGITFKVIGEDRNGNSLSETITGPASGLIVLGATRMWAITSITPSGAIDGNVEVGTNGYAIFTTAQHVAIYSAGDDTGETFTVTGEDRYEGVLTDTIVGVSAGTSTTQDQNFGRVDRITSSGASAGAVEAGVDGLCESQWFILNYRGGDFNVGLGLNIVSGTLTCAVQHTFDNLLDKSYVVGSETIFTHATITGKTADFNGNYTEPPFACRLAVTAFTSGSATLNIIQARA